MNINQQSFKSIQVLFMAMVVGQVVIGLALQFAIIDFMETPTGLIEPIKYGVPILPVLGFIGNIMINRAIQSSAGELTGIKEKLAQYRRQKVMGWAIQEGSNLITVIMAFVYQYQFFMYFFALGVLLFLLGRPSIFAFQEAYNVSDGDLQKIENE